MDPTKMTMVQWVLFGAGVGLVIGLVPLVAGFLKGKLKIGLIGFVASIVGGSIFALLLAVPISAVFTWLILRKPKTKTDAL